MEIMDIIFSIIPSGVLTLIIVWIMREWISTRLKASIQHEYDQKLETHKAKLEAEKY